MRSVFVLVVLLGIALTCAQRSAREEAALAPADVLLAGASEAALARLAPDGQPAAAAPPFPRDAQLALRALRATGRGDEVATLEAALDRAARLALVDARPRIESAVGAFDDEDAAADGGDALAAAFRASFEPDLRSALRPAAEQRLAEAGASAALEGVRNAARSLPLPRDVSVDLVSLVTDWATDRFFNSLADEAERLRQERVARGE